MKKKRLLSSLLAVSALFSCALASCSENPNHIIQNGDKNIQSIYIRSETIPDYIPVGGFDDAGIVAVIYYSDGTNEQITVTSSMLSEQERGYLNTPGTYEITLLINNRETKIHVRIGEAPTNSYTVRFYKYDFAADSYYHWSSCTVEKGHDALPPEMEEEVYTPDGMQFNSKQHFTFLGWDYSYTNVVRDLDIYPLYNKVAYYNVEFYDGNNNLISSQRIDENDDAVEPTEQERYLSGYTFRGWDRSYLNVTGDVTVRGLYSKVDVIAAPTYIYYGSYPQTSVTSSVLTEILNNALEEGENTVTYNSQEFFKYEDTFYKVEPVKWRVLEEENGNKFVISDKVIDSHVFTCNDASVMYADSPLRTWLNSTFFNDLFGEEDTRVQVSEVDNSSDIEAINRNNTFDKVYLPSYNEMNEYFFDKVDKKTEFTDYAIARRANNDSLSDHYLCRSNLNFGSYYPTVFYKAGAGTYYYYNTATAFDSALGIRPMMHII